MLIILAGVSINMVVGDNGIITQAQIADKVTTQAQQKEAIELAVTSAQAQGSLELDKTKLEEALQSQLGDIEYVLTENGDGSFLLQIGGTNYYIDYLGEVVTQENMIEIGSVDELKSFRDDVNSGNTYEGKYISLTSDITLDSNEEWESIGIYLTENTSVLDDTNKPFKGIFDGRNHTIDGIKITSKEKGKGLFGILNSGVIKNVIIGENCYIDAGISFGAITGYACNDSRIENCINKAELKANNTNFGGIVGTSLQGCTIKKCSNLGNIEGKTIVGGIVGNNAGNVSYCYNKGNMFSESSVGGICGVNTGKIEMSYNIGIITSQTTNVGGITGALQNEGSIKNCYNIAKITGTGSNVGGIAGSIFNEGCLIHNCYNIGEVRSNNNLGGAIVGVFVAGTIQNCYYLENIVNGGNGIHVKGAISKTMEEMKQIDNLLGNDFKKDSQNSNNGYPVLTWQ